MKISTFYTDISTNRKTERYVILWLVLEKVKISVALALRQTVVRSLSILVQSLDVFGFNTFMTDCYPLGVFKYSKAMHLKNCVLECKIRL